MKKQIRKIIYILIIFLVLYIIFFLDNKNKSNIFQDDILFFKEINFINTINKNTLIHQKIAPGTSGKFEILLETNENIDYKIKFKSKNDKPKNLIFQIEGKDRKYKSLEEMEPELQGEIKETKSIIINWKWEYETNGAKNRQDTEDGEKIKQYQFEIYAIGNK